MTMSTAARSLCFQQVDFSLGTSFSHREREESSNFLSVCTHTTYKPVIQSVNVEFLPQIGTVYF